MHITTSIHINAKKETVWDIITNIENSANTITAIEAVEILEQPASGLTGLKWKETRTMFGKQASEIMWITDAVPNNYYTTRAESHGAIYTTHLKVEDDNGGTKFTMEFGGEAQSLGAKIMVALTGWMIASSTKKALQKDLEDIKAAAEQ